MATTTAKAAMTSTAPYDPTALSTHRQHHNASEEESDSDGEENEVEANGWDEGGKSDCGYGDGVHETLMSIGKSIHGFVGEPSEIVQEAMNHIGNWFQEAAYAVRDFKEGKMDVGREAVQAVRSVVSGDEDNDGREEEHWEERDPNDENHSL